MSALQSRLPLMRKLRWFVLGAALVGFFTANASADFDPRGRRPKKPPAAGKPQQAPPFNTPKPRPQASREPAAQPAQRSDEVLITRYTTAALQQPGDPFPLQRLADLYRARDGNLDTLLREFEAKLTNDPANLAVLLALGYLNELEGRKDVALRFLSRAHEAHPKAPAPLLSLAAAHEAEGNSPEVARLLERALVLQKNPAEREQTLRKLRTLALERKDLEAARGYQRELVAKAGGSSFVQSELGRELLSRGMFVEASDEFERAVRASAGDNRALGPLLLELGQAQAGAQRIDAAIATLQKALSLTPAESGLRRDILNSLAAVHRHASRLAEFITWLENRRGADFAHNVLLADLYVDSGRLDDGVKAYRQALRQNTRDIDTRLKLVRLFELRGDLKPAIAEYRALIRLVPNQPQYVFQLADLLRKVGDRDGALAELDALCARASNDVDILATAVDYYEQVGEPLKAQALLVRVVAATSNPDHVVELGERYFAAGDETRAITTWKRILDLVPDKARAHHLLGEVYLEHDLTTLALEALNQAVHLAPNTSRYKRSLALGLERTGATSARAVRLQRYAEAQRLWEALLTTADTANQKREARQHITTLWSLQGSLKDRVAPLERAFRSRPPHLASGRMLAEVYQRLNQLDDAQKVLQELTKLAPGDATIWATLEQVLVNQHKLTAAIPVAERQAQLEPKRAREHYQRLARYAADLYLDDAAVKYAKKAVTLSPDDAEGYLRLGDMYRRRNELELAVQSYRKALSLNERLYPVYFSLAEVLYNQGKGAEADGLWRKLVRSANDEELIQKAARASLQFHLSAHTPGELERELLPLAIAYPQKPIYRTLLVELYTAWTTPLITALSTNEAVATTQQTRLQLEEIGKRALKPLLDVLGDAASHQQFTAVELLANLRNPDANLPLLTFAKGDAAAPLRERAFIALGASQPSNVARQLKEYLFPGERPSVDESSKVSLAAVWAYCQVGSAESSRDLYRLLDSDAPTARVLAIVTLALRHDVALLTKLGPLLESNNHEHTQAAASFALGELLAGAPSTARHVASVSRVATLAVDGAPLVRASALTALARLLQPSFGQAVTKALFSPDATLRENSARAVTAFLGRFEPDASPLESGRYREPERLLSTLLPSPPTAEQALQALHALHADLVSEARQTYAKSEAQALVIAESFTRDAGVGLSPLTDAVLTAAPETRDKAFQLALAIARELTDEFSELTTHPSARVRVAALRVLLRLDTERASEVVSRALTTSNEGQAEVVLSLLAEHPQRRVTPSIVRLLEPERKRSLRREAAATLRVAALAGHTSIEERNKVTDKLAQRLLHDDDAFVRGELAKAYAAWAENQANALLERVAREDPEPRVRNVARTILNDLD